MKYNNQEMGEISLEEQKKNNPIPNIITLMRLIGTFCLFFVKPLSIGFFIIYSLCGISDVLDGAIARATNSTSEIGAKLDSIADMLFYAVMLVKILPVLIDLLPAWVWYVVMTVLAVRLSSYLIAAVKFKKFASLHTYMNKLTGLTIFLTPYFIRESFGYVYCLVVCSVAGLASLEEMFIHLFRKDYSAKVQTISQVK